MYDASEATVPRACILLAEDDPVSALFITEALQGMGLQVDCCSDGLEAWNRAKSHSYDLLLLDCRLPGLGAKAILERLLADDAAASRRAPAVATSAEVDETMEVTLRTRGFRDVLRKPLQVRDLERSLRALLPASMTWLDEEAALRASGAPETLAALRGLFVTELEALQLQLDALLDRPHELHERLHRLQASCGFCGATPLARACEDLSALSDGPASKRNAAMRPFREVLTATLDALHAEGTVPH